MKLINIYPELVRKDDQVLMALAITFPRKLGFGEELIHPSFPFKHIDKKKNRTAIRLKRCWNSYVMKSMHRARNDTNRPYYSRPIFEAVRQDAYKVVQKILSRSYNIIDYKNQQGHNII